MRTLSRVASVLVLAGFLAIPAAEARTRVYLRIGPPPIVVEAAVPAPSRGYVWQPGYHRWGGNRYTWVAGSWARPPHRNAHWVAGRWVRTGRGYYFEPGHWSRW